MTQSNLDIKGFKEGILLIDKPENWTSHDIVAVSRKYVGTKKVGHSGTLDPMATGLLILLIGRKATVKQPYFLTLPKTYSATAMLGAETDTWDAQGEILKSVSVPELSLADVENAAKKFTGVFEQIIPPYSAKKIAGRPMYEHARKNREIEEQWRKTEVHSWRDIKFENPYVSFTVDCACGTYVRSLGHMLGRELGTAAHLSMLRREKIGELSVENAITLDELKTLPYEKLSEKIITV